MKTARAASEAEITVKIYVMYFFLQDNNNRGSIVFPALTGPKTFFCECTQSTQPIITLGRRRSSWTNGATTKICVNYSNYSLQTKQSVRITERHTFQPLCTDTKRAEINVAFADPHARATQTSRANLWISKCRLGCESRHLWQWRGSRREWTCTVPFLPVRNTHLTKGNLHIQDRLAAVI